MIVPDNKFLQEMILASAAILEAAPALRTISRRIRELQRECSSCSGKPDAPQELDNEFNELRKLLLNLPEPARQVIRSRVGNGQQIRIAYRVGLGVNTKVTSEYL